jgi:hypothetical protein
MGNGYAKFLVKVAAMLPVLLVAPVVNYAVDPANLFATPGKNEAVIAKYLLQGYNIVNWQFYDDRRIQEYVIAGLDSVPETVVLGSSRTMLIGKRSHPEWNVRNNSIAGSSLEDILGIYNGYRRRGMVPKRIIFGVDAWMFNEGDNLNRWTEIETDVHEMLAALEEKPWTPVSTFQGPLSSLRRDGLWRYLNLINLDYFQQSLAHLMKDSEVRLDFVPTKELYNRNHTKLADGTMTPAKEVRDQDSAARMLEARDYITKWPRLYLLTDFERLSTRNQRVFEKFLDFLIRQGSEVVLFLPPYHPVVQEHMDAYPDRYGQVAVAERYVRGVAARKNLPLIGSYDPRVMGVTAVDFQDGHHLTHEAVSRVVRLPSNASR